MKCRSFRFVCVIMTAILVFMSGIAVTAYTADYDTSVIRRQIIEYKMDSVGAADEQSFIDDYLAENAGSGSSEWYALCLSKDESYDFSLYTECLETAINTAGLRATDYQRMAIAYVAAGGTKIDIGAIVDATWDKLGVMSEIYALLLINSGDFECDVDDAVIVESLLGRQNDSGGWSLNGSYSDADVTAMAIQALSAYNSNPSVKSRIDSAVAVLSVMQQPDGGYKSYGVPNSESCAQVIIALCQLGIDISSDTRFIKDGNTLTDALMAYRCESGGFEHIFGSGENGMATVQAFEALTAVSYMRLYDLNERETYIEVPDIDNGSEGTSENVSEPEDEDNDKPAAPANTEITGTSHNNSESKTDVASLHQENTTSLNKNTEESEENYAVEYSQERSNNSITVKSSVSAGVSVITETTAVSSEAVSSSANEVVTETSLPETESSASGESASLVTADGAAADTSESSGGIGWKIIALTIIALLFAASQVYLIARRQFSWKRFAASAVFCAVCAGALCIIKIQSPDDYYGSALEEILPDSETVIISVSCEMIKDEIDGGYIIIPETEVVLHEEDTAFDILKRILANNEIQLDYTGNTQSDIYVRGINNIYEMDYGDMSGWMYRVNGEFPNVGCGAYDLEDGDRIEFLYTCDIGRDLGMEEYGE